MLGHSCTATFEVFKLDDKGNKRKAIFPRSNTMHLTSQLKPILQGYPQKQCQICFPRPPTSSSHCPPSLCPESADWGVPSINGAQVMGGVQAPAFSLSFSLSRSVSLLLCHSRVSFTHSHVCLSAPRVSEPPPFTAPQTHPLLPAPIEPDSESARVRPAHGRHAVDQTLIPR